MSGCAHFKSQWIALKILILLGLFNGYSSIGYTQTPILELPRISAQPGDIIDIEIGINQAASIRSFRLSINIPNLNDDYPLEFIKGSVDNSGTLSDGWILSVNDASASPQFGSVIISSVAGVKPSLHGSGVLLKFKLKVKPDAIRQVVPLELEIEAPHKTRMNDGAISFIVNSGLVALAGAELPPIITPTPRPTPTSIPTPSVSFIKKIDIHTLNANPVDGFEFTDQVEYAQSSAFLGGVGMTIRLHPGEGIFLMPDNPIELADDLYEWTATVLSTSPSVQMALVVLAYPIDGSLGYVNPVRDEIKVNQWQTLRLIYQSPGQQVIPALQLLVQDDATSYETKIYVDDIKVEPYVISPYLSSTTIAELTFDEVEEELNRFNPSTSFFQLNSQTSLTDGYHKKGALLNLSSGQIATNILLKTPSRTLSSMLLGSTMVKRQQGDDAMFAFVLADDDQTAACYIKAHHLPIDRFQQIYIGGEFNTINPFFSPFSVVQLGGLGTSGKIIVDNVRIHSQ